MKRVKEIIKNVIIFLVIMLLICFGISFVNLLKNEIQPNELFSKTGLYFLYTIGYGALEGDAVLQNILAMIGIVSLALMSTFLTINLFWRLDDVILSKEISYNDKILGFKFINNGRPICDVKATFLLYDNIIKENIAESQEYYMPMLLKKSKWNLKVDLNDTFWYRAIYDLLSNDNKKLYCIFSFVDTRNGQGSIRVEEINKNYIKNNNEFLNYENLIKPTTINCSELMSCENDGGKISSMKLEEGLMNINYSFKSKNSGFIMAYYNFHGSTLNLEKYDSKVTSLEFIAMSEKRLTLTVEVKTSDIQWSKEFELTEIPKNYKFELQDKNSDYNLENVREICFTVFPQNNQLKNNFKLGDMQIITK